MPSYIELDQQASFPSASAVGKVILGVSTEGTIVSVDKDGATTPVGKSFELPYDLYESKLSPLEPVSTKNPLTAGEYLTPNAVYQIVGYDTESFDDFSNIAEVISGRINTHLCVFKATGTTPIEWKGATQLYQQSYFTTSTLSSGSQPTPMTWSLDNDYANIYFNFSQSVDYNKVVAKISDPSGYFRVDPILDLQQANFLQSDFQGTIVQPPMKKSDQVRAIAVQSNGKILLGGQFTTWTDNNQETSCYSIVRVDGTGSLDRTFAYGEKSNTVSGFIGGQKSNVRVIAIQPDGKILVGGDFEGYLDMITNDEPITTHLNGIARLNVDGTLDTSFNVGEGFARSTGSVSASGGNVYDIKIQADGKILVGGWFESYQGQSANRIIRLNSDGSIDNTFDAGEGFSNPENISFDRVSKLEILKDGKIIVVGHFTNFDTTHIAGRFVRLHSDGAIDLTFNQKQLHLTSWANALAVQPDGKILIGGEFDRIYEYVTKEQVKQEAEAGIRVRRIDHPTKALIRLNADGSIDYTFGTGAGFNAPVVDILLLGNGQVVVGGWFTEYRNGRILQNIAKLDTDGSYVGDYNGGFNNGVQKLCQYVDRSILAAGPFDIYSPDYIGVKAEYIVKLKEAFDVALYDVRGPAAEAGAGIAAKMEERTKIIFNESVAAKQPIGAIERQLSPISVEIKVYK